MKSRKKHNPGPRRKSMKREARLQSARTTGWIEKYPGKNPVRGYAKHFAVDLLCAINELRMLGVAIDQVYEEKVKLSIKARSESKRKKKEVLAEDYRDDTFAYIAGYTSMGFPYGVTWEELDEMSDEA